VTRASPEEPDTVVEDGDRGASRSRLRLRLRLAVVAIDSLVRVELEPPCSTPNACSPSNELSSRSSIEKPIRKPAGFHRVRILPSFDNSSVSPASVPPFLRRTTSNARHRASSDGGKRPPFLLDHDDKLTTTAPRTCADGTKAVRTTTPHPLDPFGDGHRKSTLAVRIAGHHERHDHFYLHLTT